MFREIWYDVANQSSYLGFPCKDCKTPIVALTIPHGQKTPIINQGMVVLLMCPNCRSDHEYKTIEMSRHEAAQIF